MRQLTITQSITNRKESHTIEKYFNDLSKEGTITPEEEADLARRIRTSDNVALEKLVKANLRFVISVAKQYQNRNIPLNDLINEGNIGLIKAARKFDETKGFKFISYAVWWIRQSILQAINNHSKIVRIPANKKSHFNQIKKVYSSFEQVYEREPTPEELAEILEQNPSDIYNTLNADISKTSLDAPFGDDGEGNLYDVMENSSIEGTDYKMEYTQSLKHETLRTLKTLDAREMEVIKMSFGIDYDHAMNFAEIGDGMGLTRERVRQIREKALRKLKSTSRQKLLKEFCSR
jgi:RNA polymerase primary sigma factor